MKKTNEQFLKEIEKLNPNFLILDEYINSYTKIHCKCKKEGHDFYAPPYSILMGYGCPKCSGKMRKTDDEYQLELKLVHPNVIPIEKYINRSTKIKHKCLIHNY